MLAACTPAPTAKAPVAMERIVKSSSSAKSMMKEKGSSSSRAWDPDLTSDQLLVLHDGGTETPFTSPLVDEHRKGTFVSADCGEPVFRSEQKYDSGTGWPSFWAPISPGAVMEVKDTSGGMTRTEIRSKCGGHLGHVFTDGPQPTGLRYCMNGLALKFIPDAVQ
ncbi:peptide-methionine (R)-S-oxide reductase [Candidatus Peribacteria bacterium]|nr:peptide-methionine (R)-S-oxide reductase [Candidatus Peribacteria bacterium]